MPLARSVISSDTSSAHLSSRATCLKASSALTPACTLNRVLPRASAEAERACLGRFQRAEQVGVGAIQFGVAQWAGWIGDELFHWGTYDSKVK